MLVLAIDTATKIGSVALYDDKIGVLGELNLFVKTNHSNIIMKAIDTLFNLTNQNIDNVDKVAVTIGPGSFTGIRIGVAIAKGLVFGTTKKIVGINELDLIANNIENNGNKTVAMIDARKERVYYSIYEYQNDRTECISDYLDGDVTDIVKELKDSCYNFIGDGAIANKSILEGKGQISSMALSIPRAAIAAQMAIDKEDDIYSIEPFYINKSQAEREKEEKK